MIDEMTETSTVSRVLPQFPALFRYQDIIGMQSYQEKEDIIDAANKATGTEKKKDLVKRITFWGAIGIFIILTITGKFFPGILFGGHILWNWFCRNLGIKTND